MKHWRAHLSIAAVLVMTAAPAFAGEPADRVRSAVERAGYSVADQGVLLRQTERARQAGVPAEDLEVIVLRSRDRGISAQLVGELIDTAARTHKLQLPVRPVLDRIEQGLAKGVAPERIVTASEGLVEKLVAARPLVDELSNLGLASARARDREYAVEGVARALELSVPERVLMDMGESARKNGGSMAGFDRAVRSLTFLVGAGMTMDRASGLIREGVEQGFTERDFGRLERKAGEMLGRGASMDAVIDSAEREIREDRRSGGERGTDLHERGFGGGRDSGNRGGRGR